MRCYNLADLGKIVPTYDTNGYVEGTTYEKMTYLRHNGALWISLEDDVTEEPSDDSTVWLKAAEDGVASIATESTVGSVKPDGSSITITEDGTISGQNLTVDTSVVEDSENPVAGGAVYTEIDTLNSNKASKGTWYSVTLASSSWETDTTNTDYYMYSFEDTYPSTDYDILNVIPNASTTSTMRDAWAAADCGGYDSRNVVVCKGTVPTIDIVLSICVREN